MYGMEKADTGAYIGHGDGDYRGLYRAQQALNCCWGQYILEDLYHWVSLVHFLHEEGF